MPDDVTPPNEFKLPDNCFLFGGWDTAVSPYAYFERVHRTAVHSISDDRDYDADKVLAYLREHGAVVIESNVAIGEGSPSDPVKIGGFTLQTFHTYPSSSSSWSYLYQGVFIQINVKEGACTMRLFWPINTTQSVHDELKPFLLPRTNTAVSILFNSSYGMTSKSIDFTPPVIDDLELNYGTGFNKVHEQIVGKLRARQSGLILFHGPPGVGKSSYIKHLTGLIDREFIFIPIGMAADLASPSFITFLMGHTNAVLILEDAEQALQSREVDIYSSGVVATLLNLTDGLLGTVLNISIIATYNADRQTIDKALLRKGRLGYDYTFEKLSVEDAQRMADHLKKPIKVTEPLSLADIYNAEDDTGYVAPVKRAMGFGAK